MSKIVMLKVPIEIEKDGIKLEIKELTFQRLKLKHMRLLPEKVFKSKKNADLTIDEILPLITGLTGLTEEQVDDIDVMDIEAIAEMIGSLLEGSL